MPLITYIQANGDAYEAEVAVGQTVMSGAVDNMIDGILAECGGSCSCATCHCYVDAQWQEIIDGPSELEQGTLEAVLEPRDNSRLSCQIVVTQALDGLVVHLPENQ